MARRRVRKRGDAEILGAVDLGSNSFRLQVGRIVANQIYPLDGLKESVRLAAGLSLHRSGDKMVL